MKCTNCERPVQENFCSYCGHPRKPPRIDGHYVIGEISSVLSFKKGLLLTVRELLIRPGGSIRDFIDTDRNRLVKPLLFVIFCSFVYSVLQQLLNFEDGYISYSSEEQGSTTVAVFEWVQANYGYANLLMSGFVAIWVKILFWNKGYNFFEALIIIFFVFGIVMLISAVFGVLEAMTEIKLMSIGGLVSFLYCSWAIGQFFPGKRALNYLKGFLAYVLGILSSVLLLLFIVLLFDAFT